MDLQDPKVQRMLMSALVSVMLLYGFFGTSLTSFTFASRSQQISDLQGEHEQLSRDLERARLTVGNMAKLEREFDYLHRQWAVAQTLLPEEEEVSGLLRKVSAAGTQAGLDWVRFEPKASLGRGFYQENPVEVELEGGFHQVGTFLGSLSNLSRILNVRGIYLSGVKPEEQAKPESDFTLTAKMQIVAYSIDRSVVGPSAPFDAQGNAQSLSAASSGNANLSGSVAETPLPVTEGGAR